MLDAILVGVVVTGVSSNRECLNCYVKITVDCL